MKGETLECVGNESKINDDIKWSLCQRLNCYHIGIDTFMVMHWLSALNLFASIVMRHHQFVRIEINHHMVLFYECLIETLFFHYKLLVLLYEVLIIILAF